MTAVAEKREGEHAPLSPSLLIWGSVRSVLSLLWVTHDDERGREEDETDQMNDRKLARLKLALIVACLDEIITISIPLSLGI